ncbi:MAG: hypothetical protein L0H31_06585, partial [Nocardioidaceae bacterium]|nr:hypothetical protein [Nocardioidaceae bacterium]
PSPGAHQAPPWASDDPAPADRADRAAPPASSDQAPPVEEPTSRRPRMAEVAAQSEAPSDDPDAAARFDDTVVDDESSADLLARELGAEVIEELPRS